jgi:hypothetical protein
MAAIAHFPFEHDHRRDIPFEADLLPGSPAHGDDEEGLLTAARAAGFCLLQCETERRLIVWEWRRAPSRGRSSGRVASRCTG